MSPLTLELEKVKRSSASWLHVGDMRILFSYATAVAFERGPARYRTNRRFSQTTSQELVDQCSGWHRVDHDTMLQMLSDNLLAVLKDLKGSYDIVQESYRWNEVLGKLLELLGQILDQSWQDAGKLKEAVRGVHAAVIATMLKLTGPKRAPKPLFANTERGTLVGALADIIAQGELEADPSPR